MSKLQKVSFKTKKNNPETTSQPLIVELTFLSSISKKYCCSLCHSLLQDASQVTCCKANYCRDCIDRLSASTGKCSDCGKSYAIITDGVVDDLRKKIQQMKVRCINEGCKWTGSIEQLEKVHLVNPRYDERDTIVCQYQEVACPNECGVCVSRLNMRDHRFTECEKEMGVCEYCGMEMNYNQIHKIHQRMCLAVPVECPNKCLTTGVARADILKHLEEECPIRLVSCNYQHVGCEDKFQFRALKVHNIQSYQRHLDLMAERLVFVGNENKELHSENDRLQNEITVLLSKLKNFQLGLETAEDILDYYTVMNSVHDSSNSVPGPPANPVGYYSVEGADGPPSANPVGYYSVEGADGPSSANPVGYYSVEGADGPPSENSVGYYSMDDTRGYDSATVPTPAPRNVDPAKRRERSKSMCSPEVVVNAVKYQNIRKRASVGIPEVDETNIYECIDNIIVDPATADSRNPSLFPSPKEVSVPLPEVPSIRPRLRSTLSVLTTKVDGSGSVPPSVKLRSSASEPGYINERTSSFGVPLPEELTTVKPWARPPAPSTSDHEEPGVYSVPRNDSVPVVPKPRGKLSTSNKDMNPLPTPSPSPTPGTRDVEDSALPPEIPSAKPRKRVSAPSISQDNQDTPEDSMSSSPHSVTPGNNSKQPTSPAALRHLDASTGINSKQPTSPAALRHLDASTGINSKQPTASTGINSKQPTSPAALRRLDIDNEQDPSQIYEIIDETKCKNISSNPANESSTSNTVSSSETTKVAPVLVINFTDGDYQSFKMMKGLGKGVSVPATTTTSGPSSSGTGGSSKDQESRSNTYPIQYSIPVTTSSSVPRQRSHTVVDGERLSLKNARFNRKLVDAVMAGSETPSSAHHHEIPPLPPKNSETTEVETPKVEPKSGGSLMDLLADYDFPASGQTQNLIPLPPKPTQVPILPISKAPKYIGIGTNRNLLEILDPSSQDTASSKIGPKPDPKTVSKPSVMPKPGSKPQKPGSKPLVMPKPVLKPGSKPVKMQKPSSILPRLSSGSKSNNTSKTAAGTISSPRNLSLSSSGGSDELKEKLERIFSSKN